jgi:hypothetical protein
MLRIDGARRAVLEISAISLLGEWRAPCGLASTDER